ncbi:hypothetical protein [Microbulbifer sp. 2205BS26-8]|uniref:hypothetical protein n=1 Tax=Microbulbifer sp. 2205BS26-8 TaxID=3064386 RepID=UPI00273E3AC0|nr:hypothetical protein [Microbulbifer sp. 2205BS26-8]MDP5211038.1 hypothetical protein [Microbulbifer sp. 2205BS26-8]
MRLIIKVLLVLITSFSSLAIAYDGAGTAVVDVTGSLTGSGNGQGCWSYDPNTEITSISGEVTVVIDGIIIPLANVTAEIDSDIPANSTTGGMFVITSCTNNGGLINGCTALPAVGVPTPYDSHSTSFNGTPFPAKVTSTTVAPSPINQQPFTTTVTFNLSPPAPGCTL